MEPVSYQPPAAPVPPATPAYAQSCLSAAWADIKATPNYVSRLIVLGLIMCVPVLNFVVAGYLLRWAREVPFGIRTPLPQKMVDGKNFEFGFYAFLIALIAGIAGSVASAIVGWIPLLGWLVSLAVLVVVMVVPYVMQMRMIMGLSIAEGFNLRDEWEMGKRNWGQLLLVTIVPSLIVGAVIVALSFVVIMFCMVLGLGASMPTMFALSGAADPSFSQVMSLIGAVAIPMLLGTLVVYVLGSVMSVIAEALTIRGMGHWVARYAPEWTALDLVQPRY